VAFDGPAFVTVTVKVAFVPTPEPGLSVVLVRLKSELETMVVASSEVSFEVTTCPPPETEAVLVRLDAALCATLTVMLIAG
jgi:hypothetical protein